MARALARDAQKALRDYQLRHNLNRSTHREAVLEELLASKSHLSASQLLAKMKGHNTDLGQTTVYRALRVLTEAGLARELVINGEAHYESNFQRDHHDHLICSTCGAIIEFHDEEIERLQEVVAKKFGFTIESHRHEIFGQCKNCGPRKKAAGAVPPDASEN
jgi:Fur family transcriptional regulator, ferric uptake regulator